MAKFFQKNESEFDRALRIASGATLLMLTLVTGGVLKVVVGIVGIALVVTGVTGFCGLYKLFGVTTCEVKKQRNSR